MKRVAFIVVALLTLVLAAPARAWHAAIPLPPHWPTVYHDVECPGLPPGDAAGCVIDWTGQECQNAYDCVFLALGWSRYDRMHELGHVFDDQVLTDPERSLLTRLMGLGHRPWVTTYTQRGGIVVDTNRSPNEWFADAYAHCAMKLDGRGHLGIVAYFAPTPRQYDQLCAAIRMASAASAGPR